MIFIKRITHFNQLNEVNLISILKIQSIKYNYNNSRYMHQKQNLVKNKRKKEGLPISNLTNDVSHILKVINSNAMWKNSSAKLNKTLNRNTANHNKPIKKGLMTEQDIDKLFQKSKSKTKTQNNPPQDWLHNKPVKDFANSVKFLKVDDSSDRLLNGLPSCEEMDQNRIDELFQPEIKPDLTSEFRKDYAVGKIVGQGAYASVRVATYKPTNTKVAIKVYQKGKLSEPQRKKSVRRQIRILQMIKHQNIVKILNVVQTNNHLNIIMQYLDGISLNNYLKDQTNNRASQKITKTIIRSLAQALQYLHQRQISHRDIKLENIILSQDLSPKLIDFGFSTCIQKNKKVKIFCGTPSYMAPEIVQKKQYRGQPADVWALGVLTFVTLTGIFPFKGATDIQLYKKINNADYPKNQISYSKQVTDLVSKMLKINPDERITASEILTHPWLKNQLQMKKQKRPTQISQCRKRTTTSSHKSKQKQHNPLNATNARRLTETCNNENLKLQLRMIKVQNSPLKSNNNCTYRRVRQDACNKTMNPKTKKQTKTSNLKVLEMLKMGLRKVGEQKSKSKSRRF